MVPFVSPLSRPACSTTPTKLACLMYHRHNLCHHQLQHRRALHVVFIVVIFVKKLANIVKIVRSPNPTQLCSIAPKLFLTEWQYFRKKQWIRIKRAWHLVLIVVGAWGIFCSQLRNESNHLWLTSLALPRLLRVQTGKIHWKIYDYLHVQCSNKLLPRYIEGNKYRHYCSEHLQGGNTQGRRTLLHIARLATKYQGCTVGTARG